MWWSNFLYCKHFSCPCGNCFVCIFCSRVSQPLVRVPLVVHEGLSGGTWVTSSFHKDLDSQLSSLRIGKLVLPLCCYGKVLDFMIKKTLDYKSKLTHTGNAQKLCCNANHRYCSTHGKPETMKENRRQAQRLCLFVQVTRPITRG